MVKIKPITIKKIESFMDVVSIPFICFLFGMLFADYVMQEQFNLGVEIQQGIDICEEHSGGQCMPMIVEIRND